MAQNIYDRKDFFENYSKLPRSVQGLDGAPEWPTVRKLIGEVSQLSVLDLGCGFGAFCRWAAEQGATKVRGVDLSENMLTKARSLTTDTRITYDCANLEEVLLPEKEYDLVYSALTLHYLPDLRPLFAKVYASLRPGGRLVVTLEHPLLSAPSDASWKRTEAGEVFWPLNNYLQEGLRETDWLAKGVKKYHRTVESYISQLLEAGFELTGFRESWEGMRTQTLPENEAEGHRPFFLFLAAKVPTK